jgi:hypothetical protein
MPKSQVETIMQKSQAESHVPKFQVRTPVLKSQVQASTSQYQFETPMSQHDTECQGRKYSTFPEKNQSRLLNPSRKSSADGSHHSESSSGSDSGPTPHSISGFQKSFNKFLENVEDLSAQGQRDEDDDSAIIDQLMGINCQLNDTTRFRNITLRQKHLKRQNMKRRRQPHRKCQRATPGHKRVHNVIRLSSKQPVSFHFCLIFIRFVPF